MIKVLFCGLKYDYGRINSGLSFEYQNFYEVLKKMEGVEAELFAMDEIAAECGRDGMNSRLINRIQELKPDLLFCFLFTEELKKETIDYITKKTATKTFNWFADDHWRFPIYSKYWAPLFTKISTTDSEALAKYKTIGVDAIKTQWAANTWLYKPRELKVESESNFAKATSDKKLKVPEIVFVGKNYGNREEYISALKNNRLPVEAYGGGWPNGRVDDEKMLEIFSNSKINLNFTESYFNWPKQLAKLFIKKQLGKYSLNLNHPVANFQSLLGALRPQIKGRTFEVPACGGFLLTGDADNLADYYLPDKEIVIFKDKNDLVEKCKYYLEHENERKTIAQAGYQRTIKEHTYEKRFREIFEQMSLK